MLFLLIACAPASIALGEKEHTSETGRADTEDTGSAPDSGNTGNTPDTGSVPDTGTSRDTSTPDTGNIPDTGSPPDTGSGTEDCTGLVVLPRTASVVSTVDYEEISVTLAGCATGITVNDAEMIVGGEYTYSGAWIDVPEEVNAETTATLLYAGDVEPAEGVFTFTFESDQGSAEFVLFLTLR